MCGRRRSYLVRDVCEIDTSLLFKHWLMNNTLLIGRCLFTHFNTAKKTPRVT